MKIEGTFQGMDPVTSGISQAGNPWQKTYFEIITSEGERSRRVAFGAFGNVVEQVKVVPKGAHVEVKFTAESRDYIDKNGQKRYGTDLNCYGLAVITRQSLQPQYQPAQPAIPPTGYAPASPSSVTTANAAQRFQTQQTGDLPPKNYGMIY
jgi:hypothetical protein